MIYNYNYENVVLDILSDQIKGSIIGSLFSHVTYENGVVTVNFTQTLDTNQIQTLTTLVSDHANNLNQSFDYIFYSSRNTQEQNINFGRTLLHDWMRRNTLEGMSVQQSLHVFSRFEDFFVNFGHGPVKVDLFKMFYAGAMPTVYYCILQIQPDAMTESYHWLTQARLDWVKEQVESYLGAGMTAYIQSIQPQP